MCAWKQFSQQSVTSNFVFLFNHNQFIQEPCRLSSGCITQPRLVRHSKAGVFRDARAEIGRNLWVMALLLLAPCSATCTLIIKPERTGHPILQAQRNRSQADNGVGGWAQIVAGLWLTLRQGSAQEAVQSQEGHCPGASFLPLQKYRLADLSLKTKLK